MGFQIFSQSKVPPSKKICRKKQCPHPIPPPGAPMTVPTPIDVDVAHNSDNTVQWKLEKKLLNDYYEL